MSADKPEPIAFGDRALSDVTLVVGSQEFLVHRSKLAESSDVFERMLCGQFKEANQDRVEIKDVTATAFKHLMEIVYNGKIEDCYDLFTPERSFCFDDVSFDRGIAIFKDVLLRSDSDIRQLLKAADQFNMTKTVVSGVKDGFGLFILDCDMRSMGLDRTRLDMPCKNEHCARCIGIYLILLDRDGTIKLNRKFDRSAMAKAAREIAEITNKLIPMDDAKLENLANILEQLGDFKEEPMENDDEEYEDD